MSGLVERGRNTFKWKATRKSKTPKSWLPWIVKDLEYGGVNEKTKNVFVSSNSSLICVL